MNRVADRFLGLGFHDENAVGGRSDRVMLMIACVYNTNQFCFSVECEFSHHTQERVFVIVFVF